MTFHYVREGENVLTIAREHGVSPVRLIEENGLADPDRLAIGQCLAIYRSSRSYTVRGGDTFDGILRRFSIGARELLKFNPGIGEKRLLYPGQSLSLGRAETPYGTMTVNGWVRRGIPLSKLRSFASALSYLTIIDSNCSDRSGFDEQKERDLIDFSFQNGILPLLLVRPFGDPSAFAKSLGRSGYRGAVLRDTGDADLINRYAEALKSASLVCILPHSTKVADASCDWLAVGFADHREPIQKRFSELICDDKSTYRMMLELPYLGVESSPSDGACLRTLPLSDCARIAYRRNAPIKIRTDGKMCFSYDVTVSGVHKEREICFEDLASIQKGLAMLGESGVSGISVHPEASPSGLPTLLHRLFDVIKAEGERADGRYAR